MIYNGVKKGKNNISTLLDSFKIKGLHLKNRMVMLPMCQYNVEVKDGKPNDWHFTHCTFSIFIESGGCFCSFEKMISNSSFQPSLKAASKNNDVYGSLCYYFNGV
jgi:hypothetical protein